MTAFKPLNSVDNTAKVFIVNDENEAKPWTGLTSSADGLVIYVQPGDGTQIPISLAGNFTEEGDGFYRFTVPDSLYETSQQLIFRGRITGGTVYGESHQVGPITANMVEMLGDPVTPSPPVATLAQQTAIADQLAAVLDAINNLDLTGGGGTEAAYHVPILATEGGRGVPGVRVQLAGSIVSATTNTEGEATIGVGEGAHVLEVFPPPQYEAVPDIPFTAGEGAAVSILLVRKAAVATVVPADLYRIFGERNVRKWADLDGEGDPSEIEAHILDAIAVETDYVLASLAKTVSAEDAIQSPTVRDIIARFAGLSVHDNRGYEDAQDGKSDPLQKHRTHADARLKELAIGRVKIKGATLRGSSAPNVVRDR